MIMSDSSSSDKTAYWRANIRNLSLILVVWAVSSFGCGILFRDWMDANMPSVGHASFGFWMSQQGSIIVFVLLLVLYRFLMNRLDVKYGLAD
jgi:putative solute:sodium symporter small subunit